MGKVKNIHPNADIYLKRHHKEALTGQRGIAIWITGLSGAGKSSVASLLEQKLHKAGFITKVFDGDIVRSYIHKNLDFSYEGRLKNIESVAELNREFIDCGLVVINCFISPGTEMRQKAAGIIGVADFIEVYLSCSLETCEKRDAKGLYAKARNGEIKHFTGIDSPYEAPLNPHIEIDTSVVPAHEAASRIFEYVLPLISLKK